MHPAKIVFVGGGNMTQSLIAGLIADGYRPQQLWVVDRHPEKCALLEQQYQVNTSLDLAKTVQLADIVILAVKPQSAFTVAKTIGAIIKAKSPLLISIMAGIRQEQLAQWFGAKTAIVRAMPNTPALLQASATSLFANVHTSKAQLSLVERLLRSVGITVWLEQEEQLDASTAIAGSGPAYFFLIMQLLQQNAEAMGISAKNAKLLVLQTAFGAAKLALESEASFEMLCQQVASKGGTTEAALQRFAALGLANIFREVLQEAQARSIELGKRFSQSQCQLPGEKE